MGCGCSKNKVVKMSKPAQPVKTSAPKVEAKVDADRGNESSTKKTTMTSVVKAPCYEKADPLRVLRNKTVELYNKRKNETPARYMEAQRLINGWLDKIGEECPDDAAYTSLSEQINKDYARYI